MKAYPLDYPMDEKKLPVSTDFRFSMRENWHWKAKRRLAADSTRTTRKGGEFDKYFCLRHTL